MKTLKPPREKRQGRGCLTIFAVVWTVGSCLPWVAMAVPIAGVLLTGEPDILATVLSLAGMLVFTVPFFLLGVGLLVWSLWPVIVGLKVSRPEISVSSDAVRPGDTVSFIYSQTFKSAAEVKQASFQLVMRETAIYTRGTDTYTVHHEYPLQRYDVPPRSFQAGETWHDRREWQIPAEAMHTLDYPRNRLRWLVAVRVVIGGWPDFKEEYEIRVLPEVR